MGINLGVGALEAGEVVAEVVGRAWAVDGVGLGEGVAVDEDATVVEAEDGRRPADPSASGELVCLLTRRKSPTRRVDSIDPEGMRKGCAQKVMMKIAMTMRWRRDWSAGREPVLWWRVEDGCGLMLSGVGLGPGI
jgi:hypothetical protein